ncbi:RluA family pseudouridine synthase [Paenibacillus sp. NFR01]|uniref:RluA family pseudouridine synthase n=1 Tax=Paenibacillus sp. NFR01 TaxID=1566279 RepID=UPI0008C1A219|nr:RluA family pseudouridine synthase [Paenibacillus sp. NFR01]SET93512.1 23S rRNA pseudouridine1911/1915/1917 synthase [Paenibacillus sp. NFR01]
MNTRRPSQDKSSRSPRQANAAGKRSGAERKQGALSGKGSGKNAAGSKLQRGRGPGAKPQRGAATDAKTLAPLRSFQVAEPAELLPFLLEHMTGKGRNAVKAILTRGQVTVNGQPLTRHNYPLKAGDNVAVNLEKPAEVKPLTLLTILYEDNDIIVIEKEAGLLSISTGDETELTAYRQLMDYVRIANPKNRIFVVHRLDRDTSGVMMFAKSEKIQQALQDNWKEAVKERAYVALVEGAVKKPEGTISSWLKETSTLKMYSSPHEGDGQHAVTHYKLIQGNRHFSLLDVHLETGRKNQIRVHLSDIGHPIAGDKKYGAETKAVGRLGLHARILSFTHPTTGELLTFESDIPKTFLKYTAPAPTH